MAPAEGSTAPRRRSSRKPTTKKPTESGKKVEKAVVKRGRRNTVKSLTPKAGKNQPKGKKSPLPAKKQQTKSPANKKGAKKGKAAGPADKKKKTKPVTAEELEAQMDDYWQKSKDKTVAAKKLDEDMDSYWAKKGEGEAGKDEGATEENKEPAKEEETAEAK